MIDLYTWPTPNGRKISILLEELNAQYKVIPIDIGNNEQFQKKFTKISPSNKIPAIFDHETQKSIFESGAIMLYLAEKTGKLMPRDAKGRSEVIQWLMFQMAGIGPMQGQAVVFVRYFPEDIPAAKDRYINESRRLYEVLDRRLEGREWLVNDFSIADIANWSWIRSYKWARIPIEGLDNLSRWMDQMLNRPACERGANIPPSPGRADLVKKGGAAIVTT